MKRMIILFALIFLITVSFILAANPYDCINGGTLNANYCWTFDNTLTDIIIGRIATNSGAIYNTSTPFSSGSSIYANDNTDFVKLNMKDLNIGGNFTICFWLQTVHVVALDKYLIGSQVGGNNIHIRLINSNKLKFTSEDAVGNDNPVQIVNATIYSGGWNHLCFVQNGTGAYSKQIYMNGSYQTRDFWKDESYSGAILYNLTLFSRLENNLGDIGNIDQLVIWNSTALNSSQVYQVFSGTAVDITPPTFTQIPHNRSLRYFADSLYLTVNMSDETGFDILWINDTTNFNMGTTGTMQNITTVLKGTYHINISGNDTSNNVASITLEINVTNTQPNVTITSPNDLDRDNIQFIVNFIIIDVNSDTINATLLINGTRNNFTSGLTDGTITNLTSNGLTDGHYEWKILVCDPSNLCVNSTAKTFIFDSVNPLIHWFVPALVNTISKIQSYLTSIMLEDADLFKYNYTIYGHNGTLMIYNSSQILTGNATINVNDTITFFSEGNHTIEMCVCDSHTFGGLQGLQYSIDNKGITFNKGVISKRIYFGYYLNNNFQFLTNEIINQYNIHSTINTGIDEYTWNLHYLKPAVNVKFGFALKDEPNLYLINPTIGHFVWMNGIRGWYFDFTEMTTKGYPINYNYVPYDGNNYHLIWSETNYCTSNVGEECSI